MRTAKLGQLEVSRIGLGAMGMSHGYTGATDDAEVVASAAGEDGQGDRAAADADRQGDAGQAGSTTMAG